MPHPPHVAPGQVASPLVDHLRRVAAEDPERVAFRFLADGEAEAARLSYDDLDRQARAVAAALSLEGAGEPGGRALLLFPPGLEFVTAFLGCLYSGTVAVPVPPPRLNRPQPRLASVVRDARPGLVLTVSSIAEGRDRLIRHLPELGGMRWLAVDALAARDDLAEAWHPPGLGADDVAFLQYTSGSTAAPKGVIVSHGGLLHNEEMIRRAFGQSRDSVIVSWLPPFHDMGLIGGVLQPLYVGARCVLMSPMAFLQKPVRWLRAVSEHRATTSGGPDFAYALCARKVGEQERAGLDLSSWRVAFNGAEPVRAATLDAFAAVFESCGFDRRAFLPCYGLAEATLFVSGHPAGTGAVTRTLDPQALERGVASPADSAGERRDLVSCGPAWMEQEVAVVDPETRAPLPDGRVGEIWVSGPSVAPGYWKRPEETARDFRARLAGRAGHALPGPFLRTGDLGFLAGGELFVTGRLKDLIILRGRNLYPQDVELSAESASPHLRAGCTAAFSVPVEDEERLIVVAELDPRSPAREEAAEAVRRAVAEAHDAAVHEVVLVARGEVPKTSSGKIRRRACREAYLAGAFRVLARAGGAARPSDADTPAGSLLDRGTLQQAAPEDRPALVLGFLRDVLARALGAPPESLEDDRPLPGLGVDSLGAAELQHALEERLGVTVTLGDLLEGATLGALASGVAQRLDGQPDPEAAGTEAPATPRPEPEGPEVGAFPATPGQRALWFLHRLAPASAAYNLAGCARARDLDPGALRAALTAAARRHPALRTTFDEGDGDPRQVVHAELAVEIVEEDARSWPAERLRRRIEEEAQRPFDLVRGPLWRLHLWCTGEGWRLLFVIHHIVADYWSLAVLAREISLLYDRETGLPRQIPRPPALRHTDFARWHAGHLAGPEGGALLAHWLEVLAGGEPVLDLPTDRPRPPRQGFRGGAVPVSLGLDETEALRKLAREGGATTFAVLMAGFQTLLHRLTAQDRVWIGSPTAGRITPGLDDVLGYFVNPVVVAGDLSGRPSFRQVVEKVRRTALAAFEHQELPLSVLAEHLHPDRDASRSPLYQAMLVLQRTVRPGERALAALALGREGIPLALGGLELKSEALPVRSSQLDLTLALAELDGELTGRLQYDADLFDATTARRLASHFRTLLGSALADPERPVGDLALLPRGERTQVLLEWSDGGTVPGETAACLHEVVAAQARRAPDAEAVTWGAGEDGGGLWTYGELARRSGELARRLRSRGVRPEVRVGVLLDRSPELVATLLGILEAGGAYVPLDPAYPEERLRFMLEDSGARIVVTRAEILAGTGLAETLPAGLEPLFLDRAEGEPAGTTPDDPVPPASGAIGATPENLTYVIYTSGSTGRPKGVAIEHRAASALVAWARRAFSAEELSGALASTSVCFDLSVFELFVPLAAGGRVILARDALELPRLADRRVTLVNSVPSAVAELLALDGLPPSVRTVNVAGEPLQGDLVRHLYDRPAVSRVLNLYGPSEDTTYSTWAVVPRAEAREPTIGRPVAGGRLYLVEPRSCTSAPMPVGAPGEVLLGGRGVARGYLERPALTAERFVPDPFGPPGSRLYRTGDLGRHLPDGRVEFLGRIDHQVKLRGFRIELGEIEAALLGHPFVAAAVAQVRARGGDEEDRRLVAHLVPEEERGGEDLGAVLGPYLRRRLPEFMVPSSFVLLDALPLTPNGKVDRRALPEPDWGAATGSGRPPRGAVEEAVAAIWCELLGVETVHADDSFFSLGAHSLLAIRAVVRIRERLGVELPLQDLLETPTVAGIASKLATRGATEADGAARRDAAAPPTQGPAPLSFGQERLWFLDRLEPDRAIYNVPFALELEGEIDGAALRRSFVDLTRRQGALRVRFAEGDGAPVQVLEERAVLHLPQVDLQGLPAEAREGEALQIRREEARRTFDLTKAPLARSRWLRLADRRHHLLVTLHHAVADGWSLGVLARELSSLYAAHVADGSPPLPELPELPIQYPAFAAWQRTHLEEETVAAEVDFWRSRLDGLEPLPLPTDRPRPRSSSGRGGRVPLTLETSLVARLERIARRDRGTLFTALLAGLAAVLHRHAGVRDLAVGSPVAGRTRSDVEDLIGFFVNTVVLRLQVEPEPAFGSLLARARETAAEALSHQEVPFERLVQELAPEREGGRTPFFQVVLALQNAPVELPRLPGLAARELDTFSGTTKFDLTFELWQRANGVTGWIEYDASLFDDTTVRRMAGHLVRLLEAAAAEVASPVADLPMLGPGERQQLLVEWRGGAEDDAWEGHTIPALVAEHVAKRPDAVAVAGEGTALTYGELARRARALARRLTAAGVGTDAPVGVLMERSPEMAVALLAVLEAGGAYLPLDPTLPAARLGAMLSLVAGAPPILTHSRLRDRVPEDAGPVILLEAEDPPGPSPETEPAAIADPRGLAYVLFTSGSTGRPKGVAVEHRSVVRLVRGADYVRLGPGETFLQLAPVSFDASTLEIWGCLGRGGRLVIPPPDPPSLEELASLLARHRVTTLWLTAGLFHQMVETHPEVLDRVPQLLAGGDVLAPRHVRRILAGRRTPAVLVNGYGPTENTTFTCCRVLEARDLERPGVPIGEPIAGTTVELLDATFRPAATGVPAELCTGGDGLARGYLAAPRLTAERFVPDPFGGAPEGGRLYRTGDLARHLPDGRIEFLGRIDRQVKLRGFRIEPEEVESVLAKHPEVADAVVVVADGPGGESRLVAYTVPRDDLEIRHDPAALAGFLRERLPPYMVPSDFVTLDALPLTPQGKVDRGALPAPERSTRPAAGRPPETAVERAIAAVWTELLDLPEVGAEESFFDLGGHSLLATRVVSRLREELQVELSLRTLFEAPTVALLAGRIEAAGQAPVAALPAAAAEPPAPGPLSFAQERLWFFERFHPGSALYNVPLALRLAGRLVPDALASTLGSVVARHGALRTRFSELDGEARQALVPPEPLALPVVDLGRLPGPTRLEEAESLRGSEARRPFDLTRPPLLRATVLRLGPAVHDLLLSLHHVAADGWSLGILAREISRLYSAAVAGEPPSLPDLPLQYPEFARWQRQALPDAALLAGISHWEERLDGLTPLELPTDRPRPAVRRFQGGRVPLVVPPALTSALESRARQEGSTLFMGLLAGLAILLHRHSGAGDLTVGSPTGGRTRPEVEPLIGCFVNALVLRLEIAPEASVREVLGRARDTTLDALTHEETPFEKLVERLTRAGAPARDLTRPPLFQVALALLNTPLETPHLPGIEVLNLPAYSGTAKFDLALELWPEDGGLVGWIELDRDLFDETTVRRMARHLETLLEAAVRDLDSPVAELPLLSRAERHLAVLEWSGLPATPPDRDTVHGLVADRAAARPDAVAVAGQRDHLTYGELERRADLLARRLAENGVCRGHLVGVSLERSPDLVVALLAVLRAGAGYLPLDLEYPQRRIALMLEEAGHDPVVITRADLAELLPPAAGPVVLVDGPEADDRRPAAPLPRVGPDDRAYVMYTSGSTGRPKGVEITHRGIVRLVWDCDHTDLGPGRALPYLAPLTFDASTLEIWTPLATGGRLVLYPPEPPAPSELARFLATQRVTHLFLTTALFRQVVEEDARAFAPLRHVMTGGERASSESMVRALAECPGLRVSNLYGPTENTTLITYHPMEDAVGVPSSVPIGRAVAASSAFVLDPGLCPSAIGAVGELATGGAGLARGYLRRPRRTAERLVPDPFSGEAGARLYRTGDLVRHLGGGLLDFVGRVDEQVKLRGFRIEPGEVEAVLAGHPEVAEAVVQARSGPGGDRLVAYVVPRPGTAEPDLVGTLRGYVEERLPEFMRPAAYVPVDALPWTAQGKVDRRALPDPDWSAAAGTRRAPRTPLEEILAETFAGVLGLTSVGIDDSFFDLGGHSLLATRLASRLRDALDVELPLRTLFEEPTVAKLAGRIEASLGAGRSGTAPPLVPAPRAAGEVLPLSFAQERLWFLDRLEPGTALYNVPLALDLTDLTGPLAPSVLARTLAGVVERHESLRTRFVDDLENPGQVVEERVALPLPVADLRGLPAPAVDREARRVRELFARRPFDLTRAPLFRALLVRREPRRHELLLDLHHAVADGWSLGVLVEEVAALYDASPEGGSTSLPPLLVQYPDFALWQRRWLQEEVLEPALDYWRSHLDGVRPLDLPTDRPRPARPSRRGAIRWFTLPEELTAATATFCRETATSPFMVLLAGLTALLHRYTGAEDLTVGWPIAGRDRTEIEPLIGFFVNTLVLRTQVDRRRPFRELLHQVRTRALEAYARQEVPFARLVDEVAPERDLSSTPLFQVLFVLQNAPLEAPRLSGLAVEPIPLGSGTSKFDLTLALEERDGVLTGSLEYATELFDATTMDRLLAHYARLVEDALRQPEAPVGELALLGRAERHQLLVEVAPPTIPDSGRAREIHRRVAERAEATPDAVAVVLAERCLTYGELLRRARTLARRLVAAGAGPEVSVGVLAERAPEAVVAILGVLEAGSSFVPLDPSYPPERLSLMLSDSETSLVTAGSELPAALAGSGARTIPLNGDGPTEIADVPLLPLHPDQAAYVIYTSGSTGRPKGIVGSHRALADVSRSLAEGFGLEAGERLLMMPSLSFDASLGDLFPVLATGAVLHFPPTAELTPTELTALCERERMDVVDIPAALWRQWLEELPPEGALPDLARVVVGGESVSFESLDRWARRTDSRVSFLGAYGPTETTVCAAIRRTLDGTEHRGRAGRLPLGFPLAGARLYLLDDGVAPVPLGVPGEVWIGGVGVTRGYRDRPAATAQVFAPDPFGPTDGPAGSRVYRTGDLARRLADGNLEFLGRVDHQVKIRGFRIEPAEVESALSRQPAVGQALVTAREDPPGVRRLVAYVVPASGSAGEGPSPEAIRQGLEAVLPAYMVPSAVVVLDALPVSPTGKIDLAALPVPREARGEVPHVAPRNCVEESLTGVWKEVLGLESVGVFDNFFELGGDSILSLRAVARARATGLPMEARDLFQHQNVAELATALAGRATAAAETAPWVGADEVAGPLRLSPLQQGMLFESLAAPGSGVYVNQVRCTLRGAVDPVALRRAWEEVHARHEILRTAFAWDGRDEPVQEVAPTIELPWQEEDWRGLPEDEVKRRLETYLARRRLQGFDLTRAPLSHLLLARVGDADWRFAWTHHHLIVDGWSVALVLRDLFDLYGALCLREAPPPPTGRPFGEYLAWLERQGLEAAETFWRTELAGLRGPTRLGSTGSGGASAVADRRAVLHLPEGVTQALGELARHRHLTLNTVVVGTWALLLARYAGEDEVVFGVTVSGRPATLAGVEAVVGPFINTLPLRVSAPASAPVLPWLEELQRRQVALREHEHAPLSRIQAWSGLPRGTRPFETLFAFENHPVQELEALEREGVEVVDVDATGATDVPFTLSVAPGRRLRLEAAYDLHRLASSAARRILRHLRHLLEAVAEGTRGDRPDLRLGDLPLTGRSERFQAAVDWNDTLRPYPEAGALLSDLVRAQADRTPDAIAVTFENASLSYRGLATRTGRLAALLRELGVGPETRVGVCLERSLELVVALSAAVEAGGAYVPLDPDYPAERLAFLARDARPAAVVTRSPWLEGLSLPAGTPVVILEGSRPRILHGAAREAPRRQAAGSAPPPEALAYVIYTSGSTGRPKGAMNTHRGIVNRILWMQDAYGLGADDRVVQKTPYGFDVSVWEFFWPLVTGACLVVARPGGHRDGAYLARLLARERITTVHFVPSMLQAFVEEPALSHCRGLRRVIASGEALPPELVRRFFERSAAELHNLYGPTEAAVDVTAWPCPRDAAGPVPIGRPIANLRVHVLDPRGEVQPAGVAGELHLGGVGVGRGYLDRPALTAERFVPDPVNGAAKAPGARLYRTGDLARYRSDGSVEFLGRVDFQVKVRGVRIELGEIETTLAEHPGVRETVVVARDSPAGPRLVAYLVPAGDARPSPEELRRFLEAKLPEAMVPAVYLRLDAMPLSAHGKVDRRALPEPGDERPELERELVLPRTPTEERLAAAWREGLGVAEVGVHDRFLELGGNSLVALRILSRIRQDFGLDLSLPELLSADTLSELAEVVERTSRGEGRRTPSGLTPASLAGDSRLPSEIRPREGSAPLGSMPKEVLLTGATGYLGTYLLAELLQRSPARVHCLVRAAGPEEAFERLRRGLEAHGLWRERAAARLVPVPGDLSKPRLGLDGAAFERLATTVDAVIHNGALVNFAHPYEVLREPNVRGTVEILRLAATGTPKPVHHVSTADVFTASPRAATGPVSEDTPLEEAGTLPGGYLQSKWVAEAVVAEAVRRGLAVTVHRPGRVAWHSATGSWNDDDALWRILRGCLATGSAPRLERTLDVTPVDYVAAAIVHVALNDGDAEGPFHWVNPRPILWTRLIGLLRAAGCRLRTTSPAAFRRAVGEVSEATAALEPLLALGGGEGAGDEAALGTVYDCRKALAALAGSQIRCPAVDLELVRPLARRWLRSRAPADDTPIDPERKERYAQSS